MSRKRKVAVEWTEVAVGDLEEALAFVRAEDPEAADRMQRRILDAMASLPAHPRRGRVVPELLRVGIRSYREVVVAPYRVLYRAAPGVLYVMAVLHGARDVEATLWRRLTRP